MKRKFTPTRNRLILSAARLIVQEGVQNLTLEAVAAAARVSKGGLLYHFPSKDDLILGMVDLYIQRFEERITAQRDPANRQPEGWIRAYISAMLETDDDEYSLSTALIAALAVNPQLLELFRARYRLWLESFSQATNPAVAHVIRLALDGWWIATMLDLAPSLDTERAHLQTTLLSLIDNPGDFRV